MKEEFQQYGDASRPTAERSAIASSASAAAATAASAAATATAAASSASSTTAFSSAPSSSPAPAVFSGAEQREREEKEREREKDKRLLTPINENDDTDQVTQRLMTRTSSAFNKINSILQHGDENEPLNAVIQAAPLTSTASSSSSSSSSRPPAPADLSENGHPHPASGQPVPAGPPPPDPTTLQFGFGMIVTRECTKYASTVPYPNVKALLIRTFSRLRSSRDMASNLFCYILKILCIL